MTVATTLFRQACDVFDSKVRSIGQDQWTRQTPCADWSVRDLVNHVVVEDLWAPALLAGKTIAEVGDSFDGDQVGADPVAAWASAMTAAVDAAQPGVESRTVHLSYGDDSADSYLMQLFAEHLVHGWDVAKATGGKTELPADLVNECAAWFADVEPLYRSAGVLGPRVETPPGADQQTVLLAGYGRAP